MALSYEGLNGSKYRCWFKFVDKGAYTAVPAMPFVTLVQHRAPSCSCKLQHGIGGMVIFECIPPRCPSGEKATHLPRQGHQCALNQWSAQMGSTSNTPVLQCRRGWAHHWSGGQVPLPKSRAAAEGVGNHLGNGGLQAQWLPRLSSFLQGYGPDQYGPGGQGACLICGTSCAPSRGRWYAALLRKEGLPVPHLAMPNCSFLLVIMAQCVG